MKKFFLVAAMGCMLAMSASLASCDPNKAQCWKLQATFEGGAVQEEYFYGTGIEADARLEQMHQAGAVKIHREQTFLSKDNCHK